MFLVISVIYMRITTRIVSFLLQSVMALIARWLDRSLKFEGEKERICKS